MRYGCTTISQEQLLSEERKRVAPIKAKTRLSIYILLITVFCDFELFHEHHTINFAYYCEFLDKAKLAYRQKDGVFSIRNVFQKLEDLFWTRMKHPQSCDYRMFGLLKEQSGGHRFDNDTTVGIFLHN